MMILFSALKLTTPLDFFFTFKFKLRSALYQKDTMFSYIKINLCVKGIMSIYKQTKNNGFSFLSINISERFNNVRVYNIVI